VGDFEIETTFDVRKISDFPLLIWARRFEFPAVALTLLKPITEGSSCSVGASDLELDSDRVVIRDVWVVVDAVAGTELFRDGDIVRRDLIHSVPNGNFTIEVSPAPLLPRLGPATAVTIDIAGAPRTHSRSKRQADRDLLVKFDFCISPTECQTATGTSDDDHVHSALPTVTVRWPKQFDLVARIESHDGQPLRIHRQADLDVVRADLSDCGGPFRKLRWIVAKYDTHDDVVFEVHAHPDGDRTLLRIPPQTLQLLIRPGLIALTVPAGSTLERYRNTTKTASAVLTQSYVIASEFSAMAWVSQQATETTTMPVELSSAFCLASGSEEVWPLSPDPIELSSSGRRVEFSVKASKVSRSRVVATMNAKSVEHSIEQTFTELSLSFSSTAPLTSHVSLKQTCTHVWFPYHQFVCGDPIQHAVFGDLGRIEGDGLASSSDMLLMNDVLVRVQQNARLDLRFHRQGPHYEPLTASLQFETKEVKWAGRLNESSHAGDWVNVRTLQSKPTSSDYRAGSAVLADFVRINWDLAADRYTTSTVQNPAIAPNTEIVAIDDRAFRIALDPSFPRNDDIVAFPPFSLREHRDFTNSANWQSNALDAFKYLTMWEPRTAGSMTLAPPSPTEVIETISSATGGASVTAVYAGFAVNGPLKQLSDQDWAPNIHHERLAPYRAIAADSISRVQDAVDTTEPADPRQVCITDAFVPAKPPNRRRESIQKKVRDNQTEIALSPIGGTIRFDWDDEIRRIGLIHLSLHGYLGRYQENYPIFADILLPYGILLNSLTLVSRQESGEVKYCTNTWFAEESKTYGDRQNVVIRNLRPLNGVDLPLDQPLIFKADIHYKSGSGEWVDRDRTLQGISYIGRLYDRNHGDTGGTRNYITQTVPLSQPQRLTMFKDTPLRVSDVVWTAEDPNYNPTSCSAPPPDPCIPCAGVRITVVARGELEEVSGFDFDTRAVDAVYDNKVDVNEGRWCLPTGDQPPDYHARALTLGDGVVRVDKPLNRNDTFELNANAEHTVRKTITVGDIGLLQLVIGGDSDFLKNEGTLTIHERLHVHDKQVHQGGNSTRDQETAAEVDAVIDFPEFTKGVSEVCEGRLAFRIKMSPRSLHASFKKSLGADAEFDAKLVADVGVPGLLVLKNCTIQSRSGQSVSFVPGDLTPCGELLKQVFELLLEKLKGLMGFNNKSKPFTFEFLDDLRGFLVGLRLPVLRIPFGMGSLEHLTFDFRLALSIDISKGGTNAGSMLAFILGDYPKKGFGGLKWLDLDLPEIGMSIFKDLRPPTLTVTPFTVRFSTIIAVRVRPPRTHDLSLTFQEVCFDAVACISGEGGLALAFDIGVAHGSVSVTLGIVWCPHASYKVSMGPAGVKGDSYFSFDEIAVVARIELNASVLGVVNIFVRIQAMAQLKLTCEKSILTHLEVSGTASIEVLFATIDVHFTVDLDPYLGIDPNACKNVKGAPNHCALPETDEHIHQAVNEFFRWVEVAA